MRSAVSAAVRKADAVRQGCWGGLAVGVQHHALGNGAAGGVKLAV
jgi:hypothetical protein